MYFLYLDTIQNWLGTVLGIIVAFIFLPGVVFFPVIVWFIEGVWPIGYLQLFGVNILLLLGIAVLRWLLERLDLSVALSTRKQSQSPTGMSST